MKELSQQQCVDIITNSGILEDGIYVDILPIKPVRWVRLKIEEII
jgi:hypothetical protein